MSNKRREKRQQQKRVAHGSTSSKRARAEAVFVRQLQEARVRGVALCRGDVDHPPHPIDRAPICPCCGVAMVRLGGVDHG